MAGRGDRLGDAPLLRDDLRLELDGESARFDFTGTDPQRPGNVNAVEAVTVSAVAFAPEGGTLVSGGCDRRVSPRYSRWKPACSSRGRAGEVSTAAPSTRSMLNSRRGSVSTSLASAAAAAGATSSRSNAGSATCS